MDNIIDFQGLYGDEYGMLRYLFSAEINEREEDTFETSRRLLEELAICQIHHQRKRTCICLEQICPLKGLICYECLMEFHKHHASKVFKIEEVIELLKQHSIILKENEKDHWKSIHKVIEENTLPMIFKEFHSNLEGQLNELFLKILPKKNEMKPFHTIDNIIDAERIICQKLDLIGSLIKYNQDSSIQGMLRLEDLKDDLQRRMQFLGEFLEAQIEEFKAKMQAAIEVSLKMSPDITSEGYKEKIDQKKPEYEQKEEEKDREEDEEEKIENDVWTSKISAIDKKQRLLSLEENIIKRLPHLPQRTESYWPITCKKIERIKFQPLRDRIALLGFTQLKITKFENEFAKFKVTLFESYKGQDEEIIPKINFCEKEPQKNTIVHTQEMEIRPEQNEESNFLFFKKKILLKEDHAYVLELTAVENFGCTCKYGLNNQEDYQCNDILEFQPIQSECENKMKAKSNELYDEFATTLTQGIFPSLIYDIIIRDNEEFNFTF